MDTVILAGGRGARLEGVAAPFWKPLFVVNGEPLIVKVARQGVTINLGRTVVVVSPENAQPICQVLAAHELTGAVDIVVQPMPGGPGAAYLRATPLLHGEMVMILCADNVIPDADIDRCRNSPGRLVIGTRVIEDAAEARRFTLVGPNKEISEGAATGMDWEDGKYRAWLGPLVVDSRGMATAIYNQRRAGELMIGSNLDIYMHVTTGAPLELVEVDAYDIGSPDDQS